LPVDTTEEKTILEVIQRLSDSVARRMARKEAVALNVQLMIRYDDRRTITRSRKLDNPVSGKEEIYEAARFLWEEHWNGNPIRLLGVTGQDLVEKEEAFKQLDLFNYEQEAKVGEKKEALEETLNRIREKFGEGAIRRKKK
ncbi:MAG TPA: DNA polymerase IV, partial [Bacillales bacterium]|nr:DNA polymerase IV [Bacillales bacterium]